MKLLVTISKPIIVMVAVLIFNTNGFSQKFTTALSYMNYLTDQQQEISKDMWSYTSAVAHGKSARKVENRRKELLNTTMTAKNNIAKMPDFEGDISLRDSTVSYLSLCYNVLNEDYAKILDLEEIAEQSFDLMEAYMLAQQKAGEKLDVATDMVNKQSKSFASQHNINIIEGKDKLGAKLEAASKTFKYYNVVYLIFFKSYKQEAYLLDALSKEDVSAMEQNNNSLKKDVSDDKPKLDTLKAFMGDMSLKVSCKQMLDFYKLESETKIPVIINFYLKKENFEKVKKAFDAKMEMSRTKEDVDQYNKALAEYNKAITSYNSTITELNNKRSLLLNNWNKAAQTFFDRHVPRD